MMNSMETDYDEERSGWGDDIGRGGDDPNGEDALDNPQEVLQQCLDKFKTPDYIMEPGIFTQLKRYIIAIFTLYND